MSERRKIAKRLIAEKKIPLHTALKAIFLNKGSYYCQRKETPLKRRLGIYHLKDTPGVRLDEDT